MPVIVSAYSGEYLSKALVSASKLSVLLATNSSSNKPSSIITFAKLFSKATSVPILGRSQRQANEESFVSRGSIQTNLALLYLTARFIAYSTIGAEAGGSAQPTLF